MDIHKIGFCCKYKADPNLDIKTSKAEEAEFNSRTTTVAALSALSKKELRKKLEAILYHNLTSTKKLIDYVGTLPVELQMLRLGSDLLPLYTHKVAESFWFDPGVQKELKEEFAKIGALIKSYKIRTGFHPGQFCVLNSLNKKTLINSISEFEYHIDLARWMGYSKWHEDGFFCNVHVGGKVAGLEGLINNLPKLSHEARNLITIENDEYSFGVDEYLALADKVALVLDVHHHWCKTGEYIQPNDPRVEVIKGSWRGVRPLLHYSISPLDVVGAREGLLSLSDLKLEGFKVADLRKHSQDYWNPAANQWIKKFQASFDLELECKNKNLAAIKFYQE